MPRADRNIQRRGGDKDFDTSQVRGIREEKGIVIGIVKVNSHPTRMGILSVFIPTFGQSGSAASGGGGGKSKSFEDQPSQWRQVRYCSPFYSRTETIDPNNNEISVKNTAGIVYPCPDIGTRVLCFFPEGRNSEGFWFACAPDAYMMQSLPEPTMTDNFQTDASTEFLVRHPRAAALDFNDKANDTTTLKNYLQPKRALARTMQLQLKSQGLDQDEIRGLTTSSIMRETPGDLFGITTKGRRTDKQGNDISTRKGILDALNVGSLDVTPEEQDILIKPIARKRGHAFVMDDGDIEGNNNLVRIRTSHGHQILLHDTEDLIYISNGSGSAWVQIDRAGQIDLYSSVNVNVRSRNINFHADQSIKFHAGSTIQMVAAQNMHVEGGSLVNIYSDQGSAYMFGGKAINVKSGGATNIEASSAWNLKAGGDVKIQGSCIALAGSAAPAGKQNKASSKDLTDTAPDGRGFWSPSTTVKTTVDRAPTHEPYSEHAVTTQPTIYTPADTSDAAGSSETGSFPKNPPAVKDDGVNAVKSLPNVQKVAATSFVKQPSLGVSIGNMSTNTVRSIAAAATEISGSNFTYNYVNPLTSAVGKFGFTVEDLKQEGYILKEAVFNGQLDDPRLWTGKSGFNSLDDFLGNGFEQENMFSKKLINNYSTLVKDGVIKVTDDEDTVSGMLMASIASTKDVVKDFREGAIIDPQPIPGTTLVVPGDDFRKVVAAYFQKGVSASKFTRSETVSEILTA